MTPAEFRDQAHARYQLVPPAAWDAAIAAQQRTGAPDDRSVDAAVGAALLAAAPHIIATYLDTLLVTAFPDDNVEFTYAAEHLIDLVRSHAKRLRRPQP